MRRRRVFAVALVVVLGLAGLLWSARPPKARDPNVHYDESKLSQPSFRVRMEHNVRIPMRDGVELSADIYRPDVEGFFSTILVRTPYDNNNTRSVTRGKFFAERGYVVVVQDVRGRYDSDGEFYPFRNEPNDGYDTDEWIGRQPWSNGKIGTMGGSYVGFTQLSQAIKGSKYLTAMVPNVTTLDIYGNWIYTGGAFQFAFALSWGNAIDGRVNQNQSPYNWPQAFKHSPILTADEALGRRLSYYRDWVRHPTRDAYWDENSFERSHGQVAVPVLNITGWYDIFLLGLLADHAEITKNAKTAVARKNKRMMIGPWVHVIGSRQNIRPERPGDNLDFGPLAEVDTLRIQLRWFDHWLKDIDNGAADEPPIKIFVMGENRWRYEWEWPLARTRYTKYYFQSGERGANTLYGDGTLTLEPPQGSSPTDTFPYDPADPVPTLGGANCCWSNLVPMGPFDQRSVERRDDVLVYTSPELTQPVEVTGPITVTLYATSTARDTDWTAKLVDVHPNGFAQNIQDGILRARYRELGKPASLIAPGKVYEYTIDIWASSNTFLPGHHIRVEISSSNFPRFDRNLNTGKDPATGTDMIKATQTVYHNEEYSSHIVLPVIPRQ